jgi:16S rRNA C967 or C1407 C5-methylase (RsmB/RsmF family)
MRKFFDILRDNRGFVDGEAEEEEEETGADLLDLGDDDEDDESGDVEVDLSDDEEEEAPSNKAFAAMRVENKDLKQTVDTLTADVESLKATPAPQQTTYVPPDSDDPRKWTEDQWDSLAKSDWKKAVDFRSKIQAEDRINSNRTTSEFNRILEDSKQKVLIRHPELNDSNSEKSKIYRNIVTANPEYTMQKKGPVNAMYEMEEYMEKNMGYKREDILKAELKGRESEAARVNRIQLTSTTGHNLTEGSKVTITKDELDFCKLQGIDPKTYASNKKRLEKSGKGGIQL